MENGISDITDSDTDLKFCLEQFLHESDLTETPLTALSSINSPYIDIDEVQNHLLKHSDYSPKIMHLNIRSIPSKFDKLKDIIANLKKSNITLDFILVCETFLKDDTEHLFKIPGYNLITKNRQLLSKGGVAMYIKDQIHFKLLENLSIFHEGEFESIFIETTLHNKRYVVGEVYRIPDTSEVLSVKRYECLLNKLNATGANVILGTDQNFDYLKIQTHGKTLDLLNAFLSYDLIPTITKPTRITHTSATLIDNIYVRQDSPNIRSCIMPCDISDHFPVLSFVESQSD